MGTSQYALLDAPCNSTLWVYQQCRHPACLSLHLVRIIAVDDNSPIFRLLPINHELQCSLQCQSDLQCVMLVHLSIDVASQDEQHFSTRGEDDNVHIR